MVSYSATSAKSAIAYAFDNEKQYITQHQSLSKYFKDMYNFGIYKHRPPLPTVSYAWDVKTLLDQFRHLAQNNILSDKPEISTEISTITIAASWTLH